MADDLSREEVSERLEAIFGSSLEGGELEKAISSIPKRLDKFEGKWDGLIKWAEQKYGSPEESTAEPEESTAEPEESSEEGVKPKKKKKGFFGFGKSKETADDEREEESGNAGETPQKEMTREEASAKLEEIFNHNLEGKELEKMIASIPQRLDKFEGKWPKLIIWAEGKYGSAGPEESSDSETPSGEGKETGTSIEGILELITNGEMETALSNLKAMVSSNYSNPMVWNAMAAYFSSAGFEGRSIACEEKAESLS
ncbi:MAG: hypothetical protein CMB67_01265 [Euryarchaeota archaeon]|nr:hypothetical protein [Euryarchaeota archaeon]